MTNKQLGEPEARSTRERILDTAAELFVARGYVEAPLSAIAQQLDLTKAALYYHFQSKADILNGILRPLLDEVDRLLASTPTQFENAEERWQFLVAYSNLLLASTRAVRVLASVNIYHALPRELCTRIDSHRKRTTQLAMLPGMSDEAKVHAIVAMDVLNREIVAMDGRIVVQGMTTAERRAIVLRFVKATLAP